MILFEDGRYSLVGRHSSPTEEELSAIEASMANSGLKGWLAIMDRSEYAAGVAQFMMHRPMRDPAVPFEAAVRAFEATRSARERL
ncbi:hypothetical protein FE249_07010 [Acidiphilium multivorum]|uniref:hypothetical protein n=1 Tax=Acidiphilium multivorum TaxID=62140 RepID=UPI001F4C15D7|nr:hypothetical protein [Acidiphilium multivorum]UNC13984.1 hypothetical protein FE249_07010 [Acidiphilium multivorum]